VDGFRSVQTDLEVHAVRIQCEKPVHLVRNQGPVREHRNPKVRMAEDGPEQPAEVVGQERLAAGKADKTASQPIRLLDQGFDPCGLEGATRPPAGLEQAMAAMEVAGICQVDPEFGKMIQLQELSTPVRLRGWRNDGIQEKVHVKGTGNG
jgi:hypothetical protein